MYISPKQLAARLEGQDNLELRGREGIGKHKQNIPHETKVLIGVLAKTDTQKNVASAFNTTPSNVSHIVNNENLKEEIDDIAKTAAERVSSKAVDILMKSLGVVDEKIKRENARDASVIAKNIAGVVQQFTPRSTQDNNLTPRIIINIHGSKQKEEEAYETIEVESIAQ